MSCRPVGHCGRDCNCEDMRGTSALQQMRCSDQNLEFQKGESLSAVPIALNLIS